MTSIPGLLLGLAVLLSLWPAGLEAAPRPHRAPGERVADNTGVRRFALLIGANNGGPERPKLRYAASDAQAMASVLEELGGVAGPDRVLLIEPDRPALEAAITTLGRRIATEKKGAGRTEVVLYYSGHSDEEGLLLGGQRYDYLTLRRALEKLPADVRIAILDSCASGALIRAKGGKRRPPFLVDASTRVKGHAFLTSSSEDEAAQESDRLKGSFFTWSLITGLRGAADVTRDRRVSLNEAYQFAFQETLSRTERTAGGPQHPTWDIRLVGTGDLVLTDLRGSGGGIVLADDVNGRLFVRDEAGRLVAELNKPAGRAVDLGFEPGSYTVTLKSGGRTLEARLTVPSGSRLEVGSGRFTPVAVERTARRGDVPAGEAGTGQADETGAAGLEADPAELESGPTDVDGDALEGEAGQEPAAGEAVALAPVEEEGEEAPVAAASPPGRPVDPETPRRVMPLVLSFVPPLSMHPFPQPNDVTLLGLGIVGNRSASVRGLSASAAFDWIGQDLRGLQAAGGIAVTRGWVNGVQAAGGVSIAGGVDLGLQAAGGVNITTQSMRGVQAAGGVNVVGGTFLGTQFAGGLNVAADEVRGWQASGGINLAGNVFGVQSAGGLNIAGGDVYGLQVAGGINFAAGSVGSQLGVVNIAKGAVRGIQLGVINIAEDGVAPIGLFSFVRNGYHNVNVWFDETKTIHAGFKSGGRVVFNHFAIGVQPMGDYERLSATVGIGVHVGGPRIFVDVEALGTGYFPVEIWKGNNVLGTLRAQVGFQILPHLAVVAGPSINVLTTFEGDHDLDLGPDGKTLYDSEEVRVRLWPGLSAGLQF